MSEGRSRSRSRSRDGGRGEYNSGNGNEGSVCLYVSPIPLDFGKDNLHDMFKKFGRIVSSEIKRDPKTKESR